jgi:signal transduction histidine kinase
MPNPVAARSARTTARLVRLQWPLVIGAWSVPALLAALETYMFWRMAGQRYPFWRALAMEAPAWLTYALLTPAIVALGRRMPVQQPNGWRHAAVHLIAALGIGLIYAGVATTTSRAFAPVLPPISFERMVLRWYLSALPLTTLAYFVILGVGAALDFLGEARQREMDAALLSAQLAEARLGALQMQLHPHFLFNTLNAINVLARDGDMAAVSRMITLLSELLRDVLRTNVNTIPLTEELDFSRRYLAIELVRFEDRLRLRESVQLDALPLPVPCFLLQPLVENALRHGMAPLASGGTIELGARTERGVLELWVEDDGSGLPAGWSVDDYGIGLANTAARLRALHGEHGTLTVEPAARGGTRATIRLPAGSSGDAPAASPPS